MLAGLPPEVGLYATVLPLLGVGFKIMLLPLTLVRVAVTALTTAFGLLSLPVLAVVAVLASSSANSAANRLKAALQSGRRRARPALLCIPSQGEGRIAIATDAGWDAVDATASGADDGSGQ
eukprot:gene10286-13831_t